MSNTKSQDKGEMVCARNQKRLYVPRAKSSAWGVARLSKK